MAAEPRSSRTAEPSPRMAAAQECARRVELQAVLIIWLGVASALLGVLELIVIGDKLIAGGLTFGGAAVVLFGLGHGAWGQYTYWRTATS